ncbi:hypothetical protein LCL96_20770 [Rossellomorea aquimaris]|uniref:hypothetical protein n=1 Tax=Rossellomorea aquimaris TaxID=189382 RepID=UPI001CD2ABCC|nr:hypothetical protein [Rossellomorea aquimaris]MCA1061353.1 hypothetical protein [Rossellomorea aquimaris]
MAETWYTIGSFTFPSSWGGILASFVLTYLFLYFWNREASDWYSSAVFTFVIVWKLSVIVVNYQMVIEHPLTILYFHGGKVGYWLGLLAALIYTFLKRTVSSTNVITSWISTVVFFELVYHLLELDFLLAVIQFIINGTLFIFLFKKSNGPKWDLWAVQFVIVFTLLQFFFQSILEGFAFTTVTWTYLAVMIYLILLYGRRKHIE